MIFVFALLTVTCAGPAVSLDRAALEIRSGRWENARELLTAASTCLTVDASTGGDENTEARALLLHYRAVVERWMGRLKPARVLALEAVQQAERLPDSHPTLALTLDGLAQAESALGRAIEAEPHIRRALEIQLRQGAAGDIEAAGCFNTLAVLHLQLGDPDGAQRQLDRALARLNGPEGGILRAGVLHNLAHVAWQRGDADLGLVHMQESGRLAEQSLGPGHPYVRTILESQARLLRQLHRKSEAKQIETRIRTLAAAR